MDVCLAYWKEELEQSTESYRLRRYRDMIAKSFPVDHTLIEFDLSDEKVDFEGCPVILLSKMFGRCHGDKDLIGKKLRTSSHVIAIQDEKWKNISVAVMKYCKDKPNILLSQFKTLREYSMRNKHFKIWDQILVANWPWACYEPQPVAPVPRYSGLLYYGRHYQRIIDELRCIVHAGRENLFQMHVAGPSRLDNEAWKISLPDCNYHGYIELPLELQWFPAVMYYFQTGIGNIDCHGSVPHHRFFEALSAGCLQMFSSSAVRQMRNAGYNIAPYIVQKTKDVRAMLANWRSLRDRQLSDWRKPYDEMFIEQLQRIWEKIL